MYPNKLLLVNLARVTH
uniref:Uncharacterized protein n=1 Tax=Anguilla anguilla TaxID=7936 RepID=A0A0E9TVJ4_ANGAN